MYLRIVAATLASVLLAYVSLEVTVDEFGVFRHAGSPTRVCMPNSRVVKLRHLNEDLGRDAFVLGSSRANSYRVATLSRLSGRRYYNLSSPMENGVGMERWVRWLAARPGVRQVILTLDFDLQEHPYNPDDPFIQDPPGLTHEVPAAFYAQYLLTPPDQLLACVKAKIGGSRYSFDSRTGEDTEAGRRSMRFAPAHLEVFSEGRSDPSTDELERMVPLLRSRGIDVIVVVNPVWSRRFLTFNPQTYEAWLRDVLAITGGFWDFSGVNPVTADMSNYYDSGHFTPAIGDRVLDTVYRKSRNGFGVWVDASNIDRRVTKMRSEFAASRVQPSSNGATVSYRAERTPA